MLIIRALKFQVKQPLIVDPNYLIKNGSICNLWNKQKNWGEFKQKVVKNTKVPRKKKEMQHKPSPQ